MTPEQRKELKAQVVKRIADIELSIKSLEKTSKPIEPDRAIGRLTRMDAIQIQQMQEANLNTARNNISKLNESLKQIDEDKFGHCHYCQEMIGFERLKALPESNMCIKCAEKHKL